MKFFQTLAFAATCAITVLAQTPSIGELPTCARTCVGNSLGGCAQLNVQCICSNTSYISNLSCCISQGCSADDQAKTIQIAAQICAAVGVTVPTAATCSNSTSSTTAASSVSSGASSAKLSSTGSITSAGATTTASSAAAQSSKAAAGHNSGNTFGMGVAVAGLLAML